MRKICHDNCFKDAVEGNANEKIGELLSENDDINKKRIMEFWRS
jgi:hypothetical protein